MAYPAKKPQARRGDGVLKDASAQEYCWMWTDMGQAAAHLDVRRRKLAKGTGK